ncbi:MAG: GAF domain-containing sensor histidine kinase [Capsulimonadaceae bacterium]|nr:GAF domain-containing sensor histidine kinase [Capsulimonadaceae bacterium]
MEQPPHNTNEQTCPDLPDDPHAPGRCANRETDPQSAKPPGMPGTLVEKRRRRLAGASRDASIADAETAPAGKWRWDLRSDEVTWSASLYALLGMDDAAASPRPIEALGRVAKRDRALLVRAILKTATQGVATGVAFCVSGDVNRKLIACTQPVIGMDGQLEAIEGTIVGSAAHRCEASLSQFVAESLDALSSSNANSPDLYQFLETSAEFMGAATGAIWLGEQFLTATFVDADSATTDVCAGLPFPDEMTPLRRALSRGEIVEIPNIMESSLLAAPAGARLRRWLKSSGAEACAALPVLAGQSMVGLAIFGFSTEARMKVDVVQIALTIVRRLATAALLIRHSDLAVHCAVHEERSRLARELHDTMSQSLCGALMHLANGRRTLDDDREATLQALDRVSELIRSSLDEARRCVWSLRNSTLDEGGLVSAFTRLINQMTTKSSPPIKLSVAGHPRRLSSASEQCLWRLGQEALTNAIRHAQASEISIELWYLSDRVAIVVSDDGRGFDAGQLRPQGGAGLIGLHERAAAIGASLTIDSAPGKGTIVRLEAFH